MDADKTVIFKGKTINPVPDFVDATVGLSRMSVLDGYLRFPGFDDENATVEVVTQERNGSDVPVEVKFVSKKAPMHTIDSCLLMLLTNSSRISHSKVLNLM